VTLPAPPRIGALIPMALVCLLQGEPEFDRLKRELEEVKQSHRGLDGTYRSQVRACIHACIHVRTFVNECQCVYGCVHECVRACLCWRVLLGEVEAAKGSFFGGILIFWVCSFWQGWCEERGDQVCAHMQTQRRHSGTWGCARKDTPARSLFELQLSSAWSCNAM